MGNGANINIWTDSWLLEPGQERIQRHEINARYTRVADLIETGSPLWKEEIIENLFYEETARRILDIPFSSFDQNDHLVWKGDNLGIYSVKNEYRWLKATDTTANDDPNKLQELLFTKI